MLYKRVVASLAAVAFALSAKLAARAVVSIGALLRWRESCARAHFHAFTVFWLRRVAGALYATLPDRRGNATVLLGLAWKKPTLRLHAAFSISLFC